MQLRTRSIVVLHEVADELAAVVEAALRDGKLISATAVARQILDNNPDCCMTVDALAVCIGRLSTTKGVSVEFGNY